MTTEEGERRYDLACATIGWFTLEEIAEACGIPPELLPEMAERIGERRAKAKREEAELREMLVRIYGSALGEKLARHAGLQAGKAGAVAEKRR